MKLKVYIFCLHECVHNENMRRKIQMLTFLE